ncbi:MAG TPA: UbiA family prenyltransferase [Ktedonobacterales bacterium]|nr:UbiA family prenyltransferase [Ktedonobacterales bacterium]
MAAPPHPVRSPRLGGRLLGLLLVTHPLPSAMYVVMTAALALLAALSARQPLDPSALARVLLAVAAAQVAIGGLNDYCDRALDAASGRREKPLVRGLITSRDALTLVVGASIISLACFASLGLPAFLLGLLIEGLGVAYDLRFKGTPVSALLFAVYFPLFPLLAWAVFGRWQPFLLWLLPFGALLGIAMNVANTLPDLEADRAAGLRGLPHLLGPRRGMLLAWLAPPLVLLAMWALDLAGAIPARLPAMLVATAGGLLPSLAAAALYRARPAPATLRRTFLLQAVGLLALAGGWLAAVAF